MRFEKNKPSHYLIITISFLSFILASILFLFSQTKKNLIVLSGHKLIGNLEEILKLQNYKNNKIFYITFSFIEYKKLKNEYENIFITLNPYHIYLLLKSKIIISSHGLVLHKLLKEYFNIKTYFTGHAIKSNNNSKILKEQYLFDEVWLYSEFEKDIYIEECEYKVNNLVVTGYPRLDSLNKLLQDKEIIKKDLNISTKLVLYAPTDDRKNEKYINHELSPHNLDLYILFENIAKKFDLRFLIKYHINTEVDKKTFDFIKNSKYLFSFESEKLLDITPLAISDVLITDWSSVFVDYLITDNPILFLNTPMAYDISGVSKVFENKYINRLLNFEEIQQSFEKLNENNFTSLNRLSEFKKEIFNDIYSDNNLDRCLERLDL